MRNCQALASGQLSVTSADGESGATTPEVTQSPIVDEVQNNGNEQFVADSVCSSQKVQNKPNLEPKQDPETQDSKALTAKHEEQKQSQFGDEVASEETTASGSLPVDGDAESGKPTAAVEAPPLPCPDESGYAVDGQMNGPADKLSLNDLIQSGVLRTKEHWRLAAEDIASNPQFYGEVDPELLALIKAKADETES